MDMSWVIFYFLMTVGVITVIIFGSIFVGLLYPEKFVRWYSRFDGKIDVFVSAFLIAFTYILWTTIVQSHFMDGPVVVSAVEFGESGIEIVMVGLMIVLSCFHLSMQVALESWRNTDDE